MKFNIKNNNSKNRNLIKKLFYFNKIKDFLGEKRKIHEITILNREIYLKIKTNNSNNFLILVMSFWGDRSYQFNIGNEIFLSYYNNVKKADDLFCNELLRIIHGNFLADHNLIELVKSQIKLNDLLIAPSVFYQEFSSFPDDRKERLICNLNKLISKEYFERYWPMIIDFQRINNSYDKKRIALILSGVNNKKYFLKIYCESPDYISNLIRINKILSRQINTPQLIDCKIFFKEKDIGLFGLLYEYIDFDYDFSKYKKGFTDMGYKEIVKIISRLHDLSSPFLNKTIRSNQYLTVAKDYFFYKERINNHEKVKHAIEYFNASKNQKGLCHFDLELRHFLSAKNRIYLVDFDWLKYDYVILDLATFINKLIFEKRNNLIRPILEYYFEINKKNKFDKQLLKSASIIVLFIKLNFDNKYNIKCFYDKLDLIDKYYNHY